VAAPAPYPSARTTGRRRRPPKRRAKRGMVVGAGAALAAVVIAAAVVVMTTRNRAPSGPDPYAGSYPVVDLPSAAITWQPSGPPSGPLRTFSGRRSAVAGTIVDRQAKLAFARLGPPWKQNTGISTHSAGMEWTIKEPFAWWAGAYTDTLDEDFVTASKGPNGLRAAAELDARKWAKTYNGTLVAIAGQPLKVSGRNAWLAAYRVKLRNSPTKNVTERALVVVVVNAGLTVPSVFEVSVAKPKYQILPDLNTLVGSLRVIR
jgi:hypothetical protein